MKIRDVDIEKVGSFVYFGSNITDNGGSDKEVKRRLVLVGGVFNGLSKDL